MTQTTSPRRVAVLGATGSIGTSALDVIARHPDRYRASVLCAHRNVGAMAVLCRRHRPDIAIMADADSALQLRERLAGDRLPTRIEGGSDAIVAAAGSGLADVVVAAIVGAAGLSSTLAAARAGKRVLLANKEAIVMAGPLLQAALREGGGELLPVDSEHNAIFQCLPAARQVATTRADRQVDDSGIERLLLTASGGPFRGLDPIALANVTPDQACSHPNWQMGRKISVDSATLMNKGLEVIEAHHLFGVAVDAIDVVVHRQSIVHSLVQFRDGSVLAQLGNPDMRTSIAFSLAWPERIDAGVAPLDLVALGRLDFEAVDRTTFRCLDLAWQALRAGGSASALLNAANEEAVAAFLDHRIGFLDIATVIDDVLTAVPATPVDSLDGLLDADLTARRHAHRIIAARVR